MYTVVSGLLEWFMSCPTVLAACLVWASILAVIFGVLFLARG